MSTTTNKESEWAIAFHIALVAVKRSGHSKVKTVAELRAEHKLDTQPRFKRALKATTFDRLERLLYHNPGYWSESIETLETVKEIFRNAYEADCIEGKQLGFFNEAAPGYLSNEATLKEIGWM